MGTQKLFYRFWYVIFRISEVLFRKLIWNGENHILSICHHLLLSSWKLHLGLKICLVCLKKKWFHSLILNVRLNHKISEDALLLCLCLYGFTASPEHSISRDTQTTLASKMAQCNGSAMVTTVFPCHMAWFLPCKHVAFPADLCVLLKLSTG